MGRPKLDLTEEERLLRRKDQLRRANEKRRLSRKRRVENLPMEKIEKERRKKREYYLLLKKNKEEKKLKDMGIFEPADIKKDFERSNTTISGIPLISSKYQIGHNFEFTKMNGDTRSSSNNTDSKEIEKMILSTKNWKSLKWICYYCHGVLTEYESLSSHLVEMHGVINAEDIFFECDDCKEPLLGYAFFLNHIRSTHHNNLKLCCDVCNEILPDYHQLAVHRDKHIETSNNIFPAIYHCTLCEMVHSTEKVLKSHIELCHTFTNVEEKLEETFDVANEKRAKNTLDPLFSRASIGLIKCKEEYDETQQIFQCGQCVKSFNTEINLDEHMKDHIAELPFKCEICSKRFLKKNRMLIHMRIHTGERPFNCQICGKRFKSPFHRKEHMDMHTGEQPFKCEICPKSFSKSYQLKVHKEIHGDEQRFKCEVCSKGFFSKSKFMVHLKVHTGEYFKCDVCSETFLYRSKFLLHKQRHNRERPFKCEICHKIISTPQYLKIHMRIHSTERPFKCELCEKTFKFKNARNSHMIHRHSDERPHSCSTCPKRFKTIQEIKKHTIICLKRIKERYIHIHGTSSKTYEDSSCEISSLTYEDEKCQEFLKTPEDNKNKASLQTREDIKHEVSSSVCEVKPNIRKFINKILCKAEEQSERLT